MIPLFLREADALTWLQQAADAQARAKYGPRVRTSIGRCRDAGVLCRYLGIRQADVRVARLRP